MSLAPFPLDNMPLLSEGDFSKTVTAHLRSGGRAAAFFAIPQGDAFRLVMVIAWDAQGRLELLSSLAAGSFPSLTAELPQLHLFEREIFELTGLKPLGHPWLKPVRSMGPDSQPGNLDFFKVHGSEVHEVAVGPVHAGVIEPGHFRFQCHGEKVFHLEIALGYQHRGVEHRLASGPDKRGIHYAETLAGDTTAGHAWAYCDVLETLTGSIVPARAQVLRAIMLELERLANHTGDLGAMAGDVAYLPTASFCGRLRGDFLNMTALLCGNRFGRNMFKPGGVNFDLSKTLIKDIKLRLNSAMRDTEAAVGLLWKTNSVVDRFDATGLLLADAARGLGLVGPAARACGIPLDTRRNFPYGPYNNFTLSASGRGDVYARAYVRWAEIQKSAELIDAWLDILPDGPIAAPIAALKPNSAAVSLIEGWRGQICHVAVTDSNGRFTYYKVVDPSFHNWMGLVMALRNAEISDFPLCNKSFNLSYCGHDL